MTSGFCFARVGMVGLVAGTMVAGALRAAGSPDWPQFRGGDQDGISNETGWSTNALATGAKVLWKAEVGSGYSSFAVKGDRVFTSGNRDNKDTIYALSIKTGAILWQYSYACAGGGYPGPRATPATDGVLVYAFSREGQIFCLDALTGALKWEKNLMKECGAQNLKWGFSSSPVIKGDRLLVNAGKHGVALNRFTGAVIWSSPAGTGGYATPVVFNSGTGDRLALFGAKALYLVDLASGKNLGEFAWETSYDVNAADPVVHEGKIFISSGYEKGCALLDARGGEFRQLWASKKVRNHIGTCVLIQGYLYGFDGNAGSGSLKCVEFSSGEVKWEAKIGFGALTAAGGYLIVINESGTVFVIKASPTGYDLVSSAPQVLGKTCWISPVLCQGVLFCRNDKGNVVALDFSQQAAQRP
jgi:outer membrane protein assembly factor BamB